MSLRLLAKLAHLAAQRQAVHVAGAERAYMAAKDHLQRLEDKAALGLQGSDKMTITGHPVWHLSLGDQLKEARQAVAQRAEELTQHKQSLHAAYAEKMRYQSLREAQQHKEREKRSKAEQRSLDDIGQRR